MTGGFRTLGAMGDAIETGQCDLIGLARPAALTPNAPAEMLSRKDLTMKLQAPKIEMEWWKKYLRVRALGASTENVSHSSSPYFIGC